MAQLCSPDKVGMNLGSKSRSPRSPTPNQLSQYIQHETRTAALGNRRKEMHNDVDMADGDGNVEKKSDCERACLSDADDNSLSSSSLPRCKSIVIRLRVIMNPRIVINTIHSYYTHANEWVISVRDCLPSVPRHIQIATFLLLLPLGIGSILVISCIPWQFTVGVILVVIGACGAILITSLALFHRLYAFCDDRGIISLVNPQLIRTALLEKSILDVFQSIRNSQLGVVDFLLSQMLPLAPHERELIISRLPGFTRDVVKTQGLIYLTPQRFQQLVLPKNRQLQPLTLANNSAAAYNPLPTLSHPHLSPGGRLSPISASPTLSSSASESPEVKQESFKEISASPPPSVGNERTVLNQLTNSARLRVAADNYRQTLAQQKTPAASDTDMDTDTDSDTDTDNIHTHTHTHTESSDGGDDDDDDDDDDDHDPEEKQVVTSYSYTTPGATTSDKLCSPNVQQQQSSLLSGGAVASTIDNGAAELLPAQRTDLVPKSFIYKMISPYLTTTKETSSPNASSQGTMGENKKALYSMPVFSAVIDSRFAEMVLRLVHYFWSKPFQGYTDKELTTMLMGCVGGIGILFIRSRQMRAMAMRTLKTSLVIVLLIVAFACSVELSLRHKNFVIHRLFKLLRKLMGTTKKSKHTRLEQQRSVNTADIRTALTSHTQLSEATVAITNEENSSAVATVSDAMVTMETISAQSVGFESSSPASSLSASESSLPQRHNSVLVDFVCPPFFRE